ncbi:MAG: MBL fold metallo-hydrolase [Candidatus Binatia bacterium]
MRKGLVRILFELAIIATLVFVFRASLAMYVLQLGAKCNIAANIVSSLPHGLHLILCGAGSPMPDPQRSGPCVAVIAGTKIFVVDAGSGGGRNLLRLQVPTGSIAAVFLTHFHSDHIDGLGELGMLRWVGAANTTPLPVYGPTGVEQVVAGFNQAYQADSAYRTAHHGVAVAPPEGAGLTAQAVTAPTDGTPVTVWDADGVQITAFAVGHSPVSPAVGYRFDYQNRSLVISGDTKKSVSVANQAKGIDLLVHEALAANLVAIMSRAAAEAGNKSMEKILRDIPDYHTTPVEAAEIAAASGAHALLYYHIVPPLRIPGLEAAFLQGVSKVYKGQVVVGRDGTMVSLPSGSAEITFANLL